MNLRQAVMLVVLVLLLIMPVLVMADDTPDYSRSPDPVLKGDDKAYERYIGYLPEGQYILCIYVNSPWNGIGHGFIKIQSADKESSGQLYAGYGFYPPPGNSWGNYFNSPGRIEMDETHSWHYKLCYSVNKSTVVKALDVVRKWRYAEYNLFNQNCVHFVNDVIKETGVRPPSGPDAYRPGDLAENMKNTVGSVENTNEDKTREMERGIDGRWYREGEPQPRPEDQPDLTPMARGKIETPDDIGILINKKVQVVPADMQRLIADKRVLLNIEPDSPGLQKSGQPGTIGFIFEGTQVSSIEPSVSNPDYLVYVKGRTMGDFFTTEDPLLTYRAALARGDVRIVPSGAGDTVLMAGAGLLNKAGMLASPSPYLIRTGGQKEVVVGGTPFVLSRPSYAILLREPGQPDSRVINSDGAQQGYTTAGTARVIALSSQGHSQNSGVYLNPVTVVRGAALQSFSLPESKAVQGIRKSGGATQFMLQGGAGNDQLLLGGAGLANGYGRYAV